MSVEPSGGTVTPTPQASAPPLGLSTPDVTRAQALAVLKWAIAQAVALQWLPAGDAQLAVQAGSTVLAVAWIAADVLIRRRRATAAASVKTLGTASR